ncbi:MAG: sodium:solute symporter, partial [Proteobacteria bacterium]|nr:sodium:solute symporter [Pseudomonadota bacterium]
MKIITRPSLALLLLFITASANAADHPVAQNGSELTQSPFHPLDYLVLVGYLTILVFMGFYFAKRNTSTSDFFLAGHRIPWWAATLSIFSTQLSAVTFMAIPAKAFGFNWLSILVNLGIILVAPLTVFCFLPFYRRLNVTSIYEYLEKRFGPAMRVYGSISFTILQIAKMGIFLLLPSLALSTVTGVNLYLCITVMGLLCIVYTVLGGIEAVVWTDVLQSIVLLGGGLLCIGLIFSAENFNFSRMWNLAISENKFDIFTMTGGIKSDVFWVWIIGGFFIQLVPFTSDQVPMQRLLATSSERSAAKAVWAHAAIVVPASLLFFGLGTALFIFYHSRPELLPPADQNDIIVPWFIATQLPMGLAGLVIAGVFAATMSTVDSGMHSIATSLVTDVYSKLRPDTNDKALLKLARTITIIAGVLGTLSAFLVSTQDAKSLWDLILLFMALFGSSLAGVFLLGV